MSLASVDAAHADPVSRMPALLEAQRDAFGRDPFPSLETRLDRLDRLIAVLLDRREEVADAIRDDFGHRSRHESMMLEVFLPVSCARFVRKNLKAWMRPEHRPTTLALKPGSALLMPQPLGVVGVISPWNYPVQLALVPLAYALAAGNRALIKPSELTPRTSALLAKMMRDTYPEDLVSVVEGGADVAAAFSALPFDHLVFTGSTFVGRKVMEAAARNLTPVTLELGGKSPTVIHPDFPLDEAAGAIASVKLLNAGQTCVAPDYVLLHPDRIAGFVEAFSKSATAMYPRLADNPDYTSVISDRHLGRLQGYLADAREKGARLVEVNPAGESFAGTRKLAPTLVLGATPEMAVMQEEIFGPILPVLPVGSIEAAIRFVNERPRPLALYYFDRDQGRIDHLLQRTHSGGVTINDCGLHVAEEHLPFGGVGPSGMGAYHGREGFENLSHRKAVFQQTRLNGRFLTRPPYGRRVERLIDWLL